MSLLIVTGHAPSFSWGQLAPIWRRHDGQLSGSAMIGLKDRLILALGGSVLD